MICRAFSTLERTVQLHRNNPCLRSWRVRLLDLSIVGHRCIRVLRCWPGSRRSLRRRWRVDDSQLRAAVLKSLRMCGLQCSCAL